jgi:FkbM family methyltransferase
MQLWRGQAYDNSTQCRSFHVRSFGTQSCAIEWDEWLVVSALVTPAHTVLEVGARYGTTSCMIAKATNNSGRVIAVEPDATAHHFLNVNRHNHCCNFAIAKGVVSRQPLVLHRASRGYNTRTELGTNGESLPSFGIAALEAAVGSRINALLLDCEGCIDHVLGPLNGRNSLLVQLELLIIEEDEAATVNYTAWHHHLRQQGLTLVWHARDSVPDAQHACARDTKLCIHHSAWRRGANPDGRLCDMVGQKLLLPQAALQCIL